MPRERAEQFCAMLTVHLEYGRFVHLRRVLDHAEAELAEKRELAGTPPRHPSEVLVSEIFADDMRTLGVLESLGVFRLDGLLALKPVELRGVPNVGEKTIDRLQRAAREWLERLWGE